MSKFRIEYVFNPHFLNGIGLRKELRTEEVTFECDFPTEAVAAYAKERVNSTHGCTGASVYPVSEKICEVTKETPQETSTLFNGYKTKKELANEYHEEETFKTPTSTWINEVKWYDGKILVITVAGTVHGFVTDKSMFDTFRGWVESNGSPGHFYNKFIKGLPKI